MGIYATFDKNGKQTGFTTLEKPQKYHYDIDDISKQYKLVDGTVESATISELFKDELAQAKQQKLEQISKDYQDTIFSDVTTKAGYTWKADKVGGIEKTAERINNKRIMAIARKQSSMTFTDAGGTIAKLAIVTGNEIDDALREAIEIGDYIEAAFTLKYHRKKKTAEAADMDTLHQV